MSALRNDAVRRKEGDRSLMPYDIVKKGDEFCVVKKGTKKELGCHDSKAKAEKQRKALYANEASEYVGRSNVLVPIKQFSESAVADIGDATDVEKPENAYWVQALSAGDYEHWLFGTISLTEQRFNNMLGNYRNGVPQSEIAIDYEHGMDVAKGYQASGWIRDMRLSNQNLEWLIEFTDDALQEIRDKKWRYFSAEFADLYEDNQGGLYLDVVLGGGLTNRPFLKGMQALNFSEVLIAEHAEEEHSEPGTGSPPEPRPQPDREQGYPHRFDTNPDTQEEVVDFKKLFEALGLEVPENEEELTEEFALTKFAELKSEVEPLREARKEAETLMSFSEQYPEEFKRLQRLEERDRKASAKEFSDRFTRFKKKDTDETTKYGFSALVLEKIEDAHLKLSTRQLTATDLEDVLQAIGDNGIVEFGERGTAHSADEDKPDRSENPKLAFSEYVKEIMVEDSLDYSKAVSEAARREPELFKAYNNATPVK